MKNQLSLTEPVLAAVQSFFRSNRGSHRGSHPDPCATESAAHILIGIAQPGRRNDVERAVDDLGCATTTFSNGFHLIGFCADAILENGPSTRPRLIVADLVLPGLTGLSILAGIRNLGWNTPVILIADPNDQGALCEARKCGATVLCFEPLDVEQLRTVTADLLGPHARAGARLPYRRAVRTPRDANNSVNFVLTSIG